MVEGSDGKVMKIGTDIVYVPKILKLMENEGFVKRVFHVSECEEYNAEHLAGVFAAKEAFFKAIDKKPDWLKVEVRKQDTGRPLLVSEFDGVEGVDVSISHDKDYATATVLIRN
jgi:phosphopantetheine--protein transferase-like protein